ncbi:hypothetical protein Csa_006596 [Cucumis sativus]|nr:hypothetical protein Csa_006596 [Cucumis sativus]
MPFLSPPNTIPDFLHHISSLSNPLDRASRLHSLITNLEDEMKMIDAFKRELPLCMLLLNDGPQIEPVSAGIQYDREFIVCCLDLLSVLAKGLGSGIESLVSQSNLRDLLLQCCMDEALDVRQSAFALLGDLGRDAPKLKEIVYVANNFCWAIGELAVKGYYSFSRKLKHIVHPSLVPM